MNNEKEKSEIVQNLEKLDEKLTEMSNQKGAEKSEMDALHK